MRDYKKRYHDENYRDPEPVGRCAICGDPIEPGEPCYEIDGELFHAGGRRCTVEIEGRKKDLSCAMSMILRDYTLEDLAGALGMEGIEK